MSRILTNSIHTVQRLGRYLYSRYTPQTENYNGDVPAGPLDRQKEITGLKEYVDYNVTVFASTVKGRGPSSTPVLVKTDQDSK